MVTLGALKKGDRFKLDCSANGLIWTVTGAGRGRFKGMIRAKAGDQIMHASPSFAHCMRSK